MSVALPFLRFPRWRGRPAAPVQTAPTPSLTPEPPTETPAPPQWRHGPAEPRIEPVAVIAPLRITARVEHPLTCWMCGRSGASFCGPTTGCEPIATAPHRQQEAAA